MAFLWNFEDDEEFASTCFPRQIGTRMKQPDGVFAVIWNLNSPKGGMINVLLCR